MNKKSKDILEACAFALISWLAIKYFFTDLYCYIPTGMHPKIAVVMLFFAGGFCWAVHSFYKRVIWMFTD